MTLAQSPAFTCFVGIDWSGAKGERQRGITVAFCEGDGPCRLVSSPDGRAWSRPAVRDWLLACPPGTFAGVDFAFSLPWPASGPLPPGLPQPDSARALWHAVDAICRDEPHLYAGPIYHPEGGWLAAYMFTKLSGRPVWSGSDYARDRLRGVEKAMVPPPSATYRIVGAKTVGPGSFAGMRMLAAIDRQLGAGLAVWPFDPPNPSGLTMAEIYPSLYYRLAGYRRSRAPAELQAVLAAFGTTSAGSLVGLSQDEADALVGAAALRHLSAGRDAFSFPAGAERREGWTFGATASGASHDA